MLAREEESRAFILVPVSHFGSAFLHKPLHHFQAAPRTSPLQGSRPLDWVRDVRREGVDLQQRLDLGDFSIVGSQKESGKDSLIRAGGGHR